MACKLEGQDVVGYIPAAAARKSHSKPSDASAEKLAIPSWTKLFKGVKFFTNDFQTYVRIDSLAMDFNTEDSLKWLAFLESQLNLVIRKLAEIDCVAIVKGLPKTFSN